MLYSTSPTIGQQQATMPYQTSLYSTLRNKLKDQESLLGTRSNLLLFKLLRLTKLNWASTRFIIEPYHN